MEAIGKEKNKGRTEMDTSVEKDGDALQNMGLGALYSGWPQQSRDSRDHLYGKVEAETMRRGGLQTKWRNTSVGGPGKRSLFFGDAEVRECRQEAHKWEISWDNIPGKTLVQKPCLSMLARDVACNTQDCSPTGLLYKESLTR